MTLISLILHTDFESLLLIRSLTLSTELYSNIFESKSSCNYFLWINFLTEHPTTCCIILHQLLFAKVTSRFLVLTYFQYLLSLNFLPRYRTLSLLWNPWKILETIHNSETVEFNHEFAKITKYNLRHDSTRDVQQVRRCKSNWKVSSDSSSIYKRIMARSQDTDRSTLNVKIRYRKKIMKTAFYSLYEFW